jgi:hypothetical protein
MAVKKLASVIFYVVCSAAVLTFIMLALFISQYREQLLGYMLMCTAPTLIATWAFCRYWNIRITEYIGRPNIKWLIAVPLAICAVYLIFTLLIIIVTSIILFVVTLTKIL